MGYRLVAEVLNHAPADLTPVERLVLVVIAETANDHTRRGWPGLDLIAHRAGVQPGSVTKALQRLRDREFEVRVPLGVDRAGRPVFARVGQRTTYEIPRFPKRAAPSRDERVDEDTPSTSRVDEDAPTPEEGGPSSTLDDGRVDGGPQEGGPWSEGGWTTVHGRVDHHPPLLVSEPSREPSSSSSARAAADAPASALAGAEEEDDEQENEMQEQNTPTPGELTSAQRYAATAVAAKVGASPDEGEAMMRLILEDRPHTPSIIMFARHASEAVLRPYLDRVRGVEEEPARGRAHLRLVAAEEEPGAAA